MEEWKYIEGLGLDFPYQISNYGNVRNTNYRGTKKLRPVKPNRDKKGYLRVGLMVDGKQKQFRVQRLVAKAFIPNPDNRPHVNHKDEHKDNNYVKNLEWATNKENSNYGTKPNKIAKTHKTLGTYEKLRKMKSKPIIAIPVKGDGEPIHYPSIRSTAKDGFNPGNVSSVLTGRMKTHKGYRWEYEE